MKAAFIVFDGLTALDFIGFYDPITRLHVVQRLAGADARARVAAQTDYPYQWSA